MAGQTPLFVYGTLMKGMSNHACLREATGAVVRTASAVLHGAELHSFGDYSGMYLTSDSSKSLKGEILMVNEDCESAPGTVVPGARWVMGGTGCYDDVMDFCDDMQEYFGEGHPDNVYERKQVEIELAETGERINAWVYECNMSKEASEEEIESGDFLQHLIDLVPEHEGTRRVAHAE